MNWIDIVLLIVFIKNTVQGFSRGVILSVFKVAGIIVALYVGVFYRDLAVGFLKEQFAMDKFLSGIMFSPTIVDNGTLDVLNIEGIAELALSAIGFFLLFLVVQIIFSVIAYFINGLVIISRLTPFNRVLGALFGMAYTALLFALLSAVVSPFLLVFPGSFLNEGFGTSYILNHLNFLDFISPIVVKLI